MATLQRKTWTGIPRPNYTRWLGLLGAILIFLPERLPTVWGNMIVYVTSYCYIRHGNTSVASTWALAACSIGGALGSGVAGYLANVGRKKLVFLAILGSNLAIVSMYVTLQQGFAIVVFIAIGFVGFCNGISGPVIFKIISEIFGSSKGKYMSIACSGLNFGPVAINFFVGFYMNPNNLPPSLAADQMFLFEDKELTDKVPGLMIILGVSYFLCMLAGFLLLSFSLKQSPTNYTQITQEPLIDLKQDDVLQENTPLEKTLEKYTEGNRKDLTLECDLSKEKTDTIVLVEDNVTHCSVETTVENEFTILKLLKQKTFYVLSFCFGIGVFPTILLNGSYKTYGLLYTKNDNLLTVLGTLHPLVGGVSRIAWGFVLDKLRIKTCLIFLYTYISVTVMLMYFAPAIDTYLYFFTTLLVAAGANSTFPSFLLVTVAYFGEKHFCKTYALLKLSRVLFAFIISPLFEELRGNVGWFGPFACVSSLAMISLILIIAIIPDVSKDKRNS